VALVTLALGALDAGVDLLAAPIRKEETSGTARPAGWLLEAVGGGPTASGATVTEDTAMRLATVDACVSLLAEMIAAPPLEQLLETEDGRQRDVGHSNFDLLATSPNPWQTSFEWRELMMVDLLLAGNHYSELVMNSARYVTDILPLNPTRMTVIRRGQDNRLYYSYNDPDRGSRELDQDRVLHVRGKGRDGIKGMSVIAAHRETLGLAMVAQEYGSRLFSNGANMSGFFELPPQMSEPGAQANFIRYLENRHQGIRNANRFGVMDSGTKFHKTSIDPEDAQFLELRNYQRADICSIFRVPPHMIGDLSRSTNNNIEHQGIEFVTRRLVPLGRRLEQVLERDLLSSMERRRRAIRFDFSELLRGDLNSQAKFFSTGRQWGWLSANDVRRKLGENGIGAKGDRYLEPVNMVAVGEKPAKKGVTQ
jgi:HK97 family phage portal protein